MKLFLSVLFLVFYSVISSPVTCVRNNVVATTLTANVQCLFERAEPDPQYWCEANCPGGKVDLGDYHASMGEFRGLFCEKNVKTANCPCSAISEKAAGTPLKTVLDNAVSSECAAVTANAGTSTRFSDQTTLQPNVAPAVSGPTNTRHSYTRARNTLDEAAALELKAQQLEEHADSLESIDEEEED
eukprot:gene7914-12382_t